MNIVLCGDRSVLPGIHVAAYSLLQAMNPKAPKTQFTIFSDSLGEKDMALLAATLSRTGKMFGLSLRTVNAVDYANFPKFNGSLAPYFRLFAAEAMSVERFLYVDADTLCDLDVSELNLVDMGNAPVGWVPEAPLQEAVDREVVEQLAGKAEYYFNSGVLLINVDEWQKQRITKKAIDFIARYRPAFHDQSALNVALCGNAVVLEEKFNCISNMRKNWEFLTRGNGKIGRLVHFVDYPKPWDIFSEWLHPQYRLWKSVLNQTAIQGFRSWHKTPSRRFRAERKTWVRYKKAVKDRMLFAGYSNGWLNQVKGTARTNEQICAESPVKA